MTYDELLTDKIKTKRKIETLERTSTSEELFRVRGKGRQLWRAKEQLVYIEIEMNRIRSLS